MAINLENINACHFIEKNCHILRRNSSQIIFRTSGEIHQGIFVNDISSNGKFKINIYIPTMAEYFYWFGSYNYEKITLKNGTNEFFIVVNETNPFVIGIMTDKMAGKKIITISFKAEKIESLVTAQTIKESPIIIETSDPHKQGLIVSIEENIDIKLNAPISSSKENKINPNIPLEYEKEEFEIDDIATNIYQKNSDLNKMIDELLNNQDIKLDAIVLEKTNPSLLVDFSPELFAKPNILIKIPNTDFIKS